MKTPDRPDWPPEWPLIFVAHAGCERLRAEIDTHLRGVRLRPFEPTPGAARKAQTQDALNQARAALLLIDKTALASDEFLVQMQALLRRHDSAPEAFPIYPVLAGSCTWEASPLAGRQVLPLPADRDTLWARIAAALRRALHGPGAILISDPIPGPASQPQEPPPILAPAQVPAQRRTLTVLLGRNAAGEVQASYHTGAQPTPPRRTGAMPAQVSGAALYELLFPPGQDLRPLLGEPVPSRHPVRLRICTADPALIALPWQRASWNGRPLLTDGWSFEIATRADPRGAHTLPAPCKVQVHAPTTGDGDGGGLLALVTERLRRLGAHRLHGEFFHATTTPKERERSRRGLQPHLLFHRGPDLPLFDGDEEGPAPLFAWLEGPDPAQGPRRVEAMIAYAGPGNLLCEFPAQVKDYIEEFQGESRAPLLLQRVAAPMPLAEEDRADLPAALQRELEAFFEYAPPETREQMLRRQGPERLVPGTTVLLLNFGAHRAEALGADEIHAWLAFCRGYLVRHCPQELRIVTFLGYELPPERHQGFHDYMEEVSVEEDNYSDRFRLTVLPALGNVTLRHLIDFLTNPENTTCEATLARKAAAEIHRASGGSYEAAVRLIQRGEDEGFTTLLATLAPRQRRAGQPF